MAEFSRLDFENAQLHGRDKEIEQMFLAYERVVSSREPEIVLISGKAGVGKSVLAGTLRESVIGNGCYVGGKFDEIESMEPFSAIVDAYTSLCEWLLYKREVRKRVAHDFVTKLGSEDQEFLKGLLPAITSIFESGGDGGNGDAEPDAVFDDDYLMSGGALFDFENSWAFERLKVAFRDFLRILSRNDVTTALFLDDLQWADSSSLELLQFVLRDKQTKGLLLIATYRDEDSSTESTILEVVNGPFPIHQIALKDLTVDDIHSYIGGLIQAEKCDEILALAEVVHRKTLGNAFFVMRFLRMLQDEELMYFTPETHGWSWRLKEIERGTDLEDNVLALVVRSISRLNDDAVDLLKVAACFGSHFHFDIVVSIVSWNSEGEDPATTKTRLVPALESAVSNSLVAPHGAVSTYRFSHDKIQEAAYGLTSSEEERQRLHWKIGQLLQTLHSRPELRREWMYLVLVDQLNRGVPSVLDAEEREQLARLNLNAAKRVIAKSAFFPAARYLKAGRGLLGEVKPWAKYYNLQLDLLSTLAEVTFCTGELDYCSQCCTEVFENSKSVEDKRRVILVQIDTYGSDLKMGEAVDYGYRVLEELGERLPRRPNNLHAVMAILNGMRLVRGMSDEQLLALPTMSDERKRFALEVISKVVSNAFVLNRLLEVAMMSLRMVTLTLKYGGSEYAARAFSVFILVQPTVEGAYRFGMLAMKFAAKYEHRASDGIVKLTVHAFASHLRRPLHEQTENILDCYQSAMEVGDLFNAGLCIATYAPVYFNCGLPLGRLVKDTVAYAEQFKRYNQETHLPTLYVMAQSALNMMGRSANPTKLTGEVMDQQEVLSDGDTASVKNKLQVLWIMLLILSYHFQDLKVGTEAIETLLRLKSSGDGTNHFIPVYDMFMALMSLDIWRTTQKRKFQRVARQHLKDLESWSKHRAMNVQHRIQLIKCEMETLKSKTERQQLKDMYGEATTTAARSGFLNDAALANERAGRYFVSVNDEQLGARYLRRATALFDEWGAWGKVDHLLYEHSFLSEELESRPSLEKKTSSSRTKTRSTRKASLKHREFDPFQTLSDSEESYFYGMTIRRSKAAQRIPNTEVDSIDEHEVVDQPFALT